MNIMKKKPELFKRTGKSSVIIRNFLNNLKENDLHYENKQITQCVFLGVLRLKPVPSIFSNSVPSVSTTVETHRPKGIKNNNSNKELNKNVSKKNNVNKVLSGKISKKNPETLKAAVKKVPIKKPTIKIKLNTKKKLNEASSSNEKEAISSDETNPSPDSVIARSTLTLSPITSPTKFNPVQNLFDKLKQKIDEGSSEPGPSKIASCTEKGDSKLSSVKYKVCKINANGHESPSGSKKVKKTLYKKSHERLPFPLSSTSPITVSDTESTGKRDKDEVILLDESNSSNSHSNNIEGVTLEDIIIISDDLPKVKERTSPRHKTFNRDITKEKYTDKQSLITIRDEQKAMVSAPVVINVNLETDLDISPSQEVIVIPDEPKDMLKTEQLKEKPHSDRTERRDVIIVDAVKEVRVSPRLRKNEEKTKEKATNSVKETVDEVINITDEDRRLDINKKAENEIISNNPEMNITIDNLQKEYKEKTTTKLLKIVEAKEKMSLAVKKERVESEVMIINDKPKRKKYPIISPTFLPPMMLNAPMLLRSELAQKKTNYAMTEKSKIRKTRDKVKDSSNTKSSFSSLKNVNKNVSINLINTNSNVTPIILNQEIFKENITLSTKSVAAENEKQAINTVLDDDVCISDKSENKLVSQTTLEHSNVNIIKNGPFCSTGSTEKQNLKNINLKIREGQEHSNGDVIILSHSQSTQSKAQKPKIFCKALKTEPSVYENDDVILVKEENNFHENVPSRLLRSDLSKQKIPQDSDKNKKSNSIDTGITEKENKLSDKGHLSPLVSECIDLIEKPESDKQTSPRVLRSNLNKKSPITQKYPDSVLINENYSVEKEETSPQLKDQLRENRKHFDSDEIIVVNEKKEKKLGDNTNKRLLRSQLNTKKVSLERESEEVVVLIHDEPKQKPRSPVSPKKLSTQQLSKNTEDVIFVPENHKKNKIHEKSPRSSRSEASQGVTAAKTRSPKNPNLENVSTPDITIPRQISVENLEITSQGTDEKLLKENSIVKKQCPSNRLLRSDIARTDSSKSSGENVDATKVPPSPRLLRSEKSSQRQSQVKHQYLNPKAAMKGNEIPKSPQHVNCEAKEAVNLKEEPEQNKSHESHNVNEVICKNVKSLKLPVSRRSKTVLNRQSAILSTSKKIVASKKKGRKAKSLLSTSKGKLKTSMLLRSELAQLKTVDNKLPEKKVTKQVGKSKLKNKNQPTKSVKAKSVAVQTNGNSEGICFKTNNLDKTNFANNENVLEQKQKSMVNEENRNKQTTTAVVSIEVPATSKEKINIKTKSLRKSKTESQLKTNTKNRSPTKAVVINKETITPKKKSPRSSKSGSKRKLRENKSDEKLKTPEKFVKNDSYTSQNIAGTTIIRNNITKTAEITIYDFDESEPEVLPLRLSSTPKKDKSVESTNKEPVRSPRLKGNGTPKVKKQIEKEGSTTKAQAKVKLLNVFNEAKTQQSSPNIEENPELNTTKIRTPAKRKIVKNQVSEEKVPDESGKTKKDNKKVSPNKDSSSASKEGQDTSNNTMRTSTSPLKQTTITDMFNRVKLKKEKSSADSVFESPSAMDGAAVPQNKNNTENATSDMPPPKSDRRPPPSNEREDEEPYDDDSDCESRMEWIPEEYAEYKFKYSAKKMMTYKPIHKCKICLLILPTYYKLSKHKEEHAKKENPYNCKHCDDAFRNVEDLTAHLRIHKGKHPYTCKKCDIGFWSKKSLDAHTPIHVLRKVKQPNKRFRCDVCAKEFSKLCDMERHTRVHTGEKPCVCNICNKRFQQSHNLSKHLLTHLHVKPFHCEICNKQFGRNDVLNRHLLTHSVEKPIKCSVCPKGFIRQTQLNNHMKKNHPNAATAGANEGLNVTEAN